MDTAAAGRLPLRARLAPWLLGARRQSPLPLVPGWGRLPEGARLLLVRPDHLGDLLFVGPALRLLHQLRPDLRLSLLVGPWARSVAERLPGGATVETFAFPWFDRRPRGRRLAAIMRLWRQGRRLQGRFDAALILRDDDHGSAWMAAWGRLPLRAAHAHPALDPFVTHALPPRLPGRHSAALNLDLTAALAGQNAPAGGWDPREQPLGFRVLPAEADRAAALLAGLPHPLSGPLAIHPGSGAPVKRWRPEAWAALVESLLPPGEGLVLTGSAGEASLTAELAARLADRPVLDLAGRTDLGTLAAVYDRCRLVLGPDSGPLHLAVAMAVPSVHLFGPADAARFGPWGPAARHRVVASTMDCAPCGRLDWEDLAAHPCVRDLEGLRVLAAARPLAQGHPPGRNAVERARTGGR